MQGRESLIEIFVCPILSKEKIFEKFFKKVFTNQKFYVKIWASKN